MRTGRIVFGTKVASMVLAMFLLLPVFYTGAEGQSAAVGRLMKESGETEAFGGGEYIGIRFGTDALFAIVHGTEGHSNSPVIFVAINRYLGRANVFDEHNASLAHEKVLAIRTIYAVRLAALFEFNDTDGDGICNVVRTADGFGTGALVDHEPIYKAVDLNTSWKRGEVTAAGNNSEGWRSWEFTLTARNLSYISVGQVSTSGVLDRIEFRFQLTAYLEDATYTVPRYRMVVESRTGGVQTDGDEAVDVVESEKLDDEEVEGRILRYRSKVDHIIEGWDFDPTNVNRGLLLETHSILGNAMSNEMLQWMNMQFLQDQDRVGTMAYDTDEGDETVDEDGTTLGYDDREPRRLKHPRMDVNDDWGRVSRFSWVKNVTVTRNGSTTEEQMHYQVQGGRKIARFGEKGLFSGYYVVGGFSYPGGDRVVHDPSMSVSNFYQENAREESSDEGYDMVMPMMLLIILVIAAPILVLMFKKF